MKFMKNRKCGQRHPAKLLNLPSILDKDEYVNVNEEGSEI